MQILKKRRSPRKYKGVLQHFHNFEHDKTGRRHCKSSGKHSYTIQHVNGRHVISSAVAKGHGRAGKPQLFRFSMKVPGGYDMASGVKIIKIKR